MWMRIVIGLVVAVLVGMAYRAIGPGSLHARYARDVASGLARGGDSAPVTEQDLAPLPPAVQRYLRLCGVVGQPRVHNYRVHFRGRLRAGAHDPWMPVRIEQTSFAAPGERLFYLDGTMKGLPVQGLHRYVGAHATMDIRLAGLVPVVYAAGPQMDQGETVTMFNDMCLLAPATLIDPSIEWTPMGLHTVRASYTHTGHTIHADLVFDVAGELVDFVSDDRLASSPDGRTFTPRRWSTPVRDYGTFGGHRLMAHASARWHVPEGAFDYADFELLDVAYNVGAR